MKAVALFGAVVIALAAECSAVCSAGFCSPLAAENHQQHSQPGQDQPTQDLHGQAGIPAQPPCHHHKTNRDASQDGASAHDCPSQYLFLNRAELSQFLASSGQSPDWQSPAFINAAGQTPATPLPQPMSRVALAAPASLPLPESGAISVLRI